MNRIEGKFEELERLGKKALIAFVTAGDPDMGTTTELVKEMTAKGADIIELGIPFSDPIAEGPVIQAANARALSLGIKIDDIMSAVKQLRNEIQTPILYLLYLNSILQYGPARFFENCRASGVDGVIIPDLPYEERTELSEYAKANDVIIITLVSPTSEDRINTITKDVRGFLYCVSSLGVTGVRKNFDTDFSEFFNGINKASTVPKAIGFGISSADQVRELRKYCQGVIIGSAIVRIIAGSSDKREAVANVGKYIREMREVLDR